MRTGDFSELLVAEPRSSAASRSSATRPTGQPFPNNVIPQNLLSSNGLAMLSAYPLPTPGFQQGAFNAIVNSDNPQDQRKDNFRVDYHLNANNMFTYRYGKYSWTAVDAFRGTFPFARTDWDRPNTTQTVELDEHDHEHLVNEAELYLLARPGVHQRVPERPLQAQRATASPIRTSSRRTRRFRTRFPTITIDSFTEIDGGPYPSSSQGPIHSSADSATWVKSRHTFKGGIVLEYSGEDDFDQINVQPIPGSTNNQNGRFEFTNSGTGAHRRRHRRRGDGPVHELRRKSDSAR